MRARLESLGQERLRYLGIGVALGVIVITLLSFALPKGSVAAKLFLDLRADPLFPYPLTIQNLMTLMMGLGIGDVLYRRRWASRETAAFSTPLLPEDDRTVLVVEDLAKVRLEVADRAKRSPAFLHRLVDQCILQFQANKEVNQTQGVLNSMLEMEMHRVDLEYTLLRYLAWVIPTTGFIGTVVGITIALEKLAAEGAGADISVVTGDLGMAFFTTILALLYSAILVMSIQFSQRREEIAVNASSEYCLRNLINRLYVPEGGHLR